MNLQNSDAIRLQTNHGFGATFECRPDWNFVFNGK